ncbi:uncharacterized protein LOC134275398 [Saccostrea cucullata]|uniref:uncharacterized protein LOC134275398 n=1 Tax=Saccostrea cuccullata TaxID=36930 RepID=UPI002ED04C11
MNLTQGYFSDRCVHRCVFPNYGKYCQQVCQCKQSDCDHVTGCRQIQGCSLPNTKSAGRETCLPNIISHGLTPNDSCWADLLANMSKGSFCFDLVSTTEHFCVDSSGRYFTSALAQYVHSTSALDLQDKASASPCKRPGMCSISNWCKNGQHADVLNDSLE